MEPATPNQMGVLDCVTVLKNDSHPPKQKVDALVRTLSTDLAHATTEYAQEETTNFRGEREYITDYDRPIAVIVHTEFAADVPERIIEVITQRTDIEVADRKYVDDIGQRPDAEYQVRLNVRSLRK